MSSAQQPTCSCGRPTAGTVLCDRCRHTLDIALGNIPTYATDLEISLTRRQAVRYDLPRGQGGSKSMPLPLDSRFLPGQPGTLAVAQARNSVVTWVRVCLGTWPPLVGRLVCSEPLCRRCTGIRHEQQLRKPPRDTIASCCGYLQRMLPRIAGALWAEEIKRDMLDVEHSLKRVDARGPERIYAGLCTVCLAVFERTHLYAVAGDEWVKCPAEDCGMEYRVADRRHLMQDALEYEWMTAARIADLSSYLQLLGDREWVRKKLNRWHSEGVLKAAGVDDDGQPLFPFGEATRLLMAADSRRSSGLRLAARSA